MTEAPKTEKDAAEIRLLQETGDAIAKVIDQLLKGNWVDDNDHRVEDNIHMQKLGSQLAQIAEYRHKYLGYTKP